MALTRFLILLLIAAPAIAQPTRLYECEPFRKGGRGYYFVEPTVQIGTYGLHYAWSCKDSSTDAVRSYIYFCSFDACNPAQLVRSLWRVTSGQSTLTKEWAAHTTIQTPVKAGSPHYQLAIEAHGVLDQQRATVRAKQEADE